MQKDSPGTPGFIVHHRHRVSSQTDSLWGPCTEQLDWCHFPNSICSLCICVSHLGNSHSISNFMIIIFAMVTCDQWPYITTMTCWRRRWWLAFLAIKYFKIKVCTCFSDIVQLHSWQAALQCKHNSHTLGNQTVHVSRVTVRLALLQCLELNPQYSPKGACIKWVKT